MSGDERQTRQLTAAETAASLDTMVHEFKEELSRILQENEELKSKCSYLELRLTKQPKPNIQAVDSEHGTTCDKGVQCDLCCNEQGFRNSLQGNMEQKKADQRRGGNQIQQFPLNIHGEEPLIKDEILETCLVHTRVPNDVPDSVTPLEKGQEDDHNKLTARNMLCHFERGEESELDSPPEEGQSQKISQEVFRVDESMANKNKVTVQTSSNREVKSEHLIQLSDELSASMKGESCDSGIGLKEIGVDVQTESSARTNERRGPVIIIGKGIVPYPHVNLAIRNSLSIISTATSSRSRPPQKASLSELQIQPEAETGPVLRLPGRRPRSFVEQLPLQGTMSPPLTSDNCTAKKASERPSKPVELDQHGRVPCLAASFPIGYFSEDAELSGLHQAYKEMEEDVVPSAAEGLEPPPSEVPKSKSFTSISKVEASCDRLGVSNTKDVPETKFASTPETATHNTKRRLRKGFVKRLKGAGPSHGAETTSLPTEDVLIVEHHSDKAGELAQKPDAGSPKCNTNKPTPCGLEGLRSVTNKLSSSTKKRRLNPEKPRPEESVGLVNNAFTLRTIKTEAVWIPPVLEGSKPELGNDSRCDRLPTKWSTRYATRKRLTSPRLVTRKHRPPFTQSGSSPSSNNSPCAPRTGRYSHRGSTHPTAAETSPLPSTSQPFSFNRESLLRNQCEQCGRVLSSKAALQKHVSLHSGKKLFSCSLCSQIFPDPQALTRHGRVHRNGKIYICPQCNEGFAYRFGLTQHLQMVHSRIKPFVCHICQKSYFWRKDFESHFRVHTGTAQQFPCNLCDKRFNRRVELVVHLRIHSREKRHWCPYCGKEFLDYSNLKRHKYTHTGERPYACAHCTKSFVQSGHLKKHLRNVHKVDVYADLQ